MVYPFLSHYVQLGSIHLRCRLHNQHIIIFYNTLFVLHLPSVISGVNDHVYLVSSCLECFICFSLVLSFRLIYLLLHLPLGKLASYGLSLIIFITKINKDAILNIIL